ncbi:Acg family FMN-binding oxidoreductase [Allokutzneria albata]|uniref:Nitroreductase family protein n=1 Tax=Allokutzneria albata TaxID=211114 RepID=A0A1G9SKL9_ALLAB|nr:nitroreductase family protein [Allokutzneria albata]SDM35820.1 Nitroreductase family protein [Allokutzneria albata]
MSAWTRYESRTLIRALQHAPSVHNTQPWALELHERNALLFERRDIALPHHDPTGRDRLLSCGAALANLELAASALGWRCTTSLGDPVHVAATDRLAPSDVELAQFDAIPLRRSHRFPFAAEGLSAEEIRTITEAATGSGVGVHLIAEEEHVHTVAGLVEYARNVFRANRAYQHELRGWTTHRHNRRVHSGIPHERFGPGLYFGGIVRRDWPTPDVEGIAAQIRRETVLVFSTENDSRREHLLTGAALQRAWLSATALGLAASVITQPLQLSEVRRGLAARLELPGRPHALLRVGRPIHALAAVPHKPAYEFVLELPS